MVNWAQFVSAPFDRSIIEPVLLYNIFLRKLDLKIETPFRTMVKKRQKENITNIVTLEQKKSDKLFGQLRAWAEKEIFTELLKEPIISENIEFSGDLHNHSLP